MKKYLLGLFAVVLAVGFSAFTTPKKALVTFKYQLTTFTQPQVESVAAASWLQTGGVTCNNMDDKACQITVDEIYTHLDQGKRVLNDVSAPNHITISALTAASDYFVDITTSTNISAVSNKQ